MLLSCSVRNLILFATFVGLASCHSTKVIPEVKEQEVPQGTFAGVDYPAQKPKEHIFSGGSANPRQAASKGWTLAPSGEVGERYKGLLMDIRCREADVDSENCQNFLKLDSNLPTSKNSMPPSKKQVKKQKANISINMTLVDTVVEGLSFKAIPQELATVMQNVANDDIPRHNTIKRMQDLSANASKSPDILLALTWLQIKIVESGIYIDSLREDFDTGMAYYLRYDSQIEGDNYDAYTLLTIDEKLNKLSGRIKWMMDNPL